MIDLRSDTVTQPTSAMRHAMAQAVVGDDVYGEDPTINRLEDAAAERLGKEAGLFVASGTMGNLIAVLTHCPRGAAALVGDRAHIYVYEAGGASALGGVVLHPIPNARRGELPLDALQAAVVAGQNVHCPAPAVICVENTQANCGGAALSLDYHASLATTAAQLGLPIHLDGARLFNAAVALGCEARAIAAYATSVQICLSKGLGAPSGSVLAGPRPFIDRARRLRKMLGGGMRQAGVLAAPGLLALDTMVERLAEDHAHARHLALALAEAPQIDIDISQVQTNIIWFKLGATQLTIPRFLEALRKHGVLMSQAGDRVRAVTHFDVDKAGCDQAVAAVRAVLAG